MKLEELKIDGHPTIYYRPNTSDTTILMMALNGCDEYFFPDIPELKDPKVIFDIGSNIGIMSLYMAQLYPNAIIHAFEPDPDNFALLLKNTKEYKNVTCHNFGLGAINETSAIVDSTDPANLGGKTLANHISMIDSDEYHKRLERSVPCEVRSSNEIFMELGPVDIVKIDAEGAEYDIFTNLSNEVLDNITYITGEIHNVKTWRLLDFLDSRFHLQLRKDFQHKNWPFFAINSQKVKI